MYTNRPHNTCPKFAWRRKISFTVPIYSSVSVGRFLFAITWKTPLKPTRFSHGYQGHFPWRYTTTVWNWLVCRSTLSFAYRRPALSQGVLSTGTTIYICVTVYSSGIKCQIQIPADEYGVNLFSELLNTCRTIKSNEEIPSHATK